MIGSRAADSYLSGARSLLLTEIVGVLTLAAIGCGQPTAAPTGTTAPAASPSPSPIASPAGAPIMLRGGVAVTANSEDRSLSVVDVDAARVVATVPLERPPRDVDLAPDARLAFATDNSPGSRSVVVADLTTARQIGEVTVGSQPDGILISARTGQGYIANSGDNSLTLFDAPTRAVAASVQVGDRPHGVIVVGVGGAIKAFVTNEGAGTVSVVDVEGRRVLETVQLGGRPTEVDATPDGSRVFVLDEGADGVVVLDAQTHRPLATIRVGSNLTGLAASPDGRFLYITANAPSRNLARIDLATNQLAGEFDVGAGALAVVAGREPGRIFITTADNRLVFWDTGANRAATTLPVGRRPGAVAVGVAPAAPSPSPVPAVRPSPAVEPSPPARVEPTPLPAAQSTPTDAPSKPGPTVAPSPQPSPTP